MTESGEAECRPLYVRAAGAMTFCMNSRGAGETQLLPQRGAGCFWGANPQPAHINFQDSERLRGRRDDKKIRASQQARYCRVWNEWYSASINSANDWWRIAPGSQLAKNHASHSPSGATTFGLSR